MMAQCLAPAFMKQAVEDLRRQLDLEKPDWTEYRYFCRWCRADHSIVSGERQLLMLPAHQSESLPGSKRHLPSKPAGASANYCRWHRTSSPRFSAPCVFCGTELHVHQDSLGGVKSGRLGAGFMVEKCPACHRKNAVVSVYDENNIKKTKTILTRRLDNGHLALQTPLKG